MSSSRDNCSLHRWVLLKNSIIRSSPSSSATTLDKTDVNPVYTTYEEDDEVCFVEEADSFMFPDASRLNACGGADAVTTSEAEWLDLLLETLGDENEDDEADVNVAILPVDDDDEYQSYSPMISPMSSSDDLINQQPAYYPSPIAIPYPVPYPPFHPPPESSSYDHDDVEDLPVPDCIEDTSDDESDTIRTSSLVDPASVPLPAERRPRPQLYIYSNDFYFYPFELDPLPLPDNSLHSYNHLYQEC
jgi:hypothetical protein